VAVDQFLKRAEIARARVTDQPAIVTGAGEVGIWEGFHLGTPVNS
jgi:hypothetical protein